MASWESLREPVTAPLTSSVTVRVRLMPAPGAAQNLFQTGVRCAPSQHRPGPLHCRDELRWITGAPRTLDGRERSSRDTPGGRDDLAHGTSRSRPQIHRQRRATVELRVERAEMRVGDVADMNIVPYRGPI